MNNKHNNIVSRSTVNITDNSNLPKQSPHKRYAMNDLGSVYSHYDENLHINVTTENKLKGGK